MSAETETETVLVLAPFGRDAGLVRAVLREAHIETEVCESMAALCARLQDAGAAIVTAEALDVEGRRMLIDAVGRQPAWSDFPILVFPTAGARARADDVRVFGNATLLERPVAVRALTSAVENALRGRRRQYQARRAIRERDNFLAMLGHELRNPLAAISLSVAGLERTSEPARIARHVTVIERQTGNLTKLVDDLLDVSRVTTGRIEIKHVALDLVDLVERTVALFEAPAQASKLSLTLTLPPDDAGPVAVSGDAVRLEQILNNLLTNAVKYTPAGGRVNVTLEASATVASIHVKDTGVGIPADTLPHVFDLFVQAPGSLDRSRGGLGIGLTLVRSLTVLHGGSVEAHSGGPGRGSELVVRLPRAAALERAAEPRRAPPARSSVLVVDDSEDVRESLREILEGLGHEVATAADGAGGLARLLDLVPAVAIIDIGLPILDGYEVARAARRALGKSVRLVALTGYGQPEDKERAHVAGFDAHFTKPVDVRLLERMLEERPDPA